MSLLWTPHTLSTCWLIFLLFHFRQWCFTVTQVPCKSASALPWSSLTDLQPREVSQLAGKEGILSEERKEGSVSHWQSRWAGEEEQEMMWEGRERKRSLLEQAFSCCLCSTEANATGLRSKFLYLVLIPPSFNSVTFLILLNTLPEMFCNALWETRLLNYQ